ncbi:hypothetical protein IDJ77_13105 [Mucilaginibacter sp. ZT4R22]|uniref:DUF5977 domain-containing protein n=1 Tax=Mucilaginibacter pankratovii TaxID=2772110 RepID=A0ABR7WR24_9SPHI|nr:DUF5977 domain-containing protein [Mucilaginibacter pankratovii]MBD1364752.1 hypothetical protein [Mucilaginibacter pankratovii]
MKKILSLFALLICYAGSFAQTLSPSASTFESDTYYTITVNGETNSAYLNNISYPRTDNTSPTFNGTNYLTADGIGQTNLFMQYQVPASKTQFTFKVTNVNTINMQVTFSFNVSGPGIPSKKLTFTVNVKPKAAIFYNVAKTQFFTKNNCGTGYTGTSVAYSVPANKYNSTTQADADQKAQNEINANGQAQANANGSCFIDYSHWFTSWDHSMRYNGSDWSTDMYWNKDLVATTTVTIQVYQSGVFKGVVATGVPNTGHAFLDFTPYLTLHAPNAHTFENVSLKIISDSNTAISDFSDTYDMQVD